MSEQHYIYRIVRDEYPESPREWSNLGVTACWHNRYNLGDEQPTCDTQEYLADLIGWDDDKQQAVHDYWFNRAGGSDEERYTEARNKLEERIQKEFDKRFISLPVYLYDHGSLTISTGSFSCPWDSGQLGLIYVSKDKVRQEYGIKHVTRFWEEKIKGYLALEVKTYDEFLTGQVYGYRIFEVPEGVDPGELSEEEIEALEEVDSLWGIYGEEYAEQEAKESAACFEEHYAELMFKRQQAEFRAAGQLELALAA